MKPEPDPRWVLLKYTKDFPSHVIQKSLSELHRYLSYLPSKSITGFEHVVLKTQNGKQETYNIGIPINLPKVGTSPFSPGATVVITTYLTTIPEFIAYLFSLD